MFGDSPDLISIGRDALRTISLGFPVIGPSIIGSSTFQALGMGMPNLILSFSRQLILLLPLAFLLGRIGGLDLIWYSFPISEMLVTVVMVFWLKRTLLRVFAEK